MTHTGCTLTELQDRLAAAARVRITASTAPAGQWVSACWSCGCCAEGPRFSDLLLLQRCNAHRQARHERPEFALRSP